MKKEYIEEVRDRLVSIGRIVSNDIILYELFKKEIKINEEPEVMFGSGEYVLLGRDFISDEIIEGKFANIIVKWILTGKREYYNTLKNWFIEHLLESIKNKKTAVDKLANNRKESGFIYIIKVNDFYKIGKTKKIKGRIKKYITENPYLVKVVFKKEVNNYVETEEALLKKFEKKRIRGEWFKLTKNDINWIRQNIQKL